MGKSNPTSNVRKAGDVIVDRKQALLPRGVESRPRKTLLMAGTEVCDLVWKNDTAYCEFRGQGTPTFMVEVSVVLDTVRKMVKAE